MTTTELYVWGEWGKYRDLFRSAKQSSLDLHGVLLKPVEATPGCGRLLAFGSPPPFAADYALIRKKPEDLPGKMAAHLLRWYVGQVEEPHATTMADWLSMTFGRRVVEIG